MKGRAWLVPTLALLGGCRRHGLQDVKGKMGRLLALDRELAQRLGVPAACL